MLSPAAATVKNYDKSPELNPDNADVINNIELLQHQNEGDLASCVPDRQYG